jgi:EAL domain-containing protein (putative c-di-GMP-specific phosphodiesterase class I)
MQGHVLIMGDPGDRRDGITQEMATAAMEITVTADAADATRTAAASLPEAMLLLDSPACDALEAARAVRADRRLHGCMLIAVAHRDRHVDLLRAGVDQAVGLGVTPWQVLEAVQGRLARRRQLLDTGGADARRHGAEGVVEAMLTQGRLRGVIVLRVERLDALSAALGGEASRALRGEFRQRLAPLLPRGCELVMMDDGAAVAVDAGGPPLEELAVVLMKKATAPLSVAGRELRLRLHAGMAEARGQDAPTLLQRAEVTARQAQDAGTLVPQGWSDDMAARVLDDLQLASAIRRAVDRAEFRLVFQPIVRMDRGDPFGAEAFIRWTPADGVSVPPARFVAAAEANGLIEEIGTWSLREACRQAARWLSQGLRLRVSVNVSPRQLTHGRLVETVRRALSESGVSGDQLAIELPESALLHDDGGLRLALEALRTLGVAVCVDDFGAGLATLAMLRGQPIDEIKIDRSFIRPLPGSTDDRLAVDTVLKLAHRLGWRALAMGVEHAAQWIWLKDQGCDAAQGWLMGRPVEADAFLDTVALLRRTRGQFTADPQS